MQISSQLTRRTECDVYRSQEPHAASNQQPSKSHGGWQEEIDRIPRKVRLIDDLHIFHVYGYGESLECEGR